MRMPTIRTPGKPCEVTFDEDAPQNTHRSRATGDGHTCRDSVIGALRNTGWENSAAGLRHHGRHPDHAPTGPLTS